jgi:hypothetical protein
MDFIHQYPIVFLWAANFSPFKSLYHLFNLEYNFFPTLLAPFFIHLVDTYTEFQLQQLRIIGHLFYVLALSMLL